MFTLEDFFKLPVVQQRRKLLFAYVLLLLMDRGPVTDRRSVHKVLFAWLPEHERKEKRNSVDSIRGVVEDLKQRHVVTVNGTSRTTREVKLATQLHTELVDYLRKQTGMADPEEGPSDEGAYQQLPAETESAASDPQRLEHAQLLLDLLAEGGLARLAPLVIDSVVSWVVQRGPEEVLRHVEEALAEYRLSLNAEREILQRRLEESEQHVLVAQAEVNDLQGLLRAPRLPQAGSAAEAQRLKAHLPEPAPRRRVSTHFWSQLTPRQFDVYKTAILGDEPTFRRSIISERLGGKVSEEDVERQIRDGMQAMLVILSNATDVTLFDEGGVEEKMHHMVVEKWGTRPFKSLCVWLGEHRNQTKSDVDFLKLAEEELMKITPRYLSRKLRDIAQTAMRRQRERHGRDAESAGFLDRNRGHKQAIRK